MAETADIDDVQVTALFRQLDKDGSGHISIEEFVKGIEALYHSELFLAPTQAESVKMGMLMTHTEYGSPFRKLVDMVSSSISLSLSLSSPISKLS